MQTPTVLRLTIVAATLCFVQSCGGSDGGTQPSGTTSSGIALTLFPSTATARQAELTVVVATALRTGGYSGAITFTVEGAPTGMAVVVTTPSTIGSSTAATISFTPGLSVAAGTYNLIIRAKGSGVSDATATLAFTVTGAQAQFTLVPLTRTLSIPAGGRDSTLVLVARNLGFTGPVTLSLLNAPSGITATSNPATVAASATQAWLTLNTTAAVATGSYTITIRGSATGQSDATTTVQLTVASGTSSGNVTLDLSACAPNNVLWVAGQDGTGAWARLSGANNLYRFNVTSGKGGLAWVSDLFGTKTLHVRLATQAELTAAPVVPCRAVGSKIVNGSVAGLKSSEFAQVWMGGGGSVALAASTSIGMVGVKDGPQDLTAYRYNFPDDSLDRVIVRRDQNLATGATLAALNLAAGSAEAVKTDTAKTLLTGLIAQEIPTFGLAYLTGAACEPSLFKLWASIVPRNATDSILLPGVPASIQRATDFHEFLITTGNGTENPGSLMLGTPVAFAPLPAARTTRVFYHSVARRTVALGAPLTPPTVTKISAPYARLQAVLTIPADYTSSVSIDYGTGQAEPSVSFLATLGWLGATAGGPSSVSVALPDFSSVAGWDNTWAPSSSRAIAWDVTATGTNISTTQCVEGGFIKTARLSGSVN
jgi:hypothetical protein